MLPLDSFQVLKLHESFSSRRVREKVWGGRGCEAEFEGLNLFSSIPLIMEITITIDKNHLRFWARNNSYSWCYCYQRSHFACSMNRELKLEA